MNKRFLKVAVTSALAISFAVPAFAASANPFSDVPQNHWAYQSIQQLAKAGVISGYNDGTFKGDKTITRYEMAQIVAKAMNKSVSADQKAIVDKLANEFSSELDNLGVKVDGIQKQLDNQVKIGGDARVRYFSTEDNKDITDYRARVTFDGKINDNLKFSARLAGGTAYTDGRAAAVVLDTANVTAKFLGMNTTVGRQDIKLGTGFLADSQMNGLASQMGDVKLYVGNISDNNLITGSTYAPGWERIYGAELKGNLMGAAFTADYLKNTTTKEDFYGVNTSFGLFNGVTANVDYAKNNTADAKAMAYGVKFNDMGLSVTYRDVDAGALTKFSTMNVNGGTAGFYGDASTGFKGMEYQYDKAMDKNATLTLKYQDFEKQDGTKLPGRTSAAVNVKF